MITDGDITLRAVPGRPAHAGMNPSQRHCYSRSALMFAP
jgi:hypothetical protein